uniref:Heterokaryon incompatibility domain-containing protein n=1 Tax=Moniliophthora roreri TaxID=221103 RepID=A0A0W0GDE9_MONRR
MQNVPRASEDSPEIILEVALQPGTENVIDLRSVAAPEQFRLVDCELLSRESNPILQIHEFNVFPPPKSHYSAISYVWHGNPLDPSKTSQRAGTIVVEGARDSDPIDVDILRHACIASSKDRPSIKYIWLDRLCIMQTDEDDKAWQIRKMFDIYRLSSLCLVLPGGLRRLVGLEEETEWILRAWTLQEAIVPAVQELLFSLDSMPVPKESTMGAVITDITHPYGRCNVKYIVHGLSATADLRALLRTIRVHCTDPRFYFHPTDVSVPMVTKILGSIETRRRELLALADATETVWTGNNFSRHAIWQSSFLRTSKRPVDMVLSIMGLFGVALDPRVFKSTDRISATIALAQAILSRGDHAEWLIAGWNEPPDRRLSSFPELPDTSVAAPPYFPTTKRDISREIDTAHIDIRFRFAQQGPVGSMDGQGYFQFTAKAAKVYRAQQEIPLNGPEIVQDLDGSLWAVCGEHDAYTKGAGSDSQFYVVVLGIATARDSSGNSYRQAKAVLLHQQATGKFYRPPVFFELAQEQTEQWHEMQLNMGPIAEQERL